MMLREKKSSSWFGIFASRTRNGEYTYKKEVIMAVAALLLVSGGVFGYRWYTVYREKNAQKLFADCLYTYEKAQSGVEMLAQAEEAFKKGYEQSASSSLAPFFLVYQADIVLQQKRPHDALALLDQALTIMPKTSPFYTLYQTKRALVRMDTPHMQQAGTEELLALAADTTNMHRDMALYYIGLGHWHKNDMAQAQRVWQDLAALKTEQRGSQSPWAVMAADKLALIA